MPMQIGLDELISMLLARIDSLTVESETQKSRFNIMFRMLYKKGLFSEEDAFSAVKDEHLILHELGLIKDMPDDQAIKGAADNLMLWVKGDVETIRQSLEDYDRRLKEAMEEQNKPKIDVAPAAVLNELDRLGGQGGSGKKLII
ncbi:MAG: hypothetical protein IJ576_05525 [Synergistaceae bacterium]|nr:hypothetical protein [Synergistaceae bacterium]MBR1418407.1 hypothetical protein [Synergistaceae bacterium]MBR1603269.1 hypothetical protein [Synergistaceae bacterium]